MVGARLRQGEREGFASQEAGSVLGRRCQGVEQNNMWAAPVAVGRVGKQGRTRLSMVVAADKYTMIELPLCVPCLVLVKAEA